VLTPTSIAPVDPEDRQTPGIETNYGTGVRCETPAFLQGFKMFLKDAAIRKRRVERAAEMEEEPEPVRPPTTSISFGPKRSVVRYEMPEVTQQAVVPRESPKKSPPKVSPPKRKPFLSDSARQTLKRGAKAVGTAAASAAAAALARRYQTQLAAGADRVIGSAFDYFDGPRGTPPPNLENVGFRTLFRI